MYRSIRLLSQPLIKAREKFFESKKVVGKDFLKFVVIGGCCQFLLCLIVEEFGLPTPDICFDARRMISPEFNNFIKNGNYAGFDMTLNAGVKSYKIEKGQITKPNNKNDFGGAFYKSSL